MPYVLSWTGPGGFTSTSEDITGLSTGLYSLNLTDANTCAVFTLDSFYSIAKAHDVTAQSLHRFVKTNRAKHQATLDYSAA